MTITARVAVVDDNPATRYSTSRTLRSAGFEVSEGSKGSDALELAPGVDILLLDVNLPDMHGFEVCRKLRQEGRTARLPVIHVSATFVQDFDKAQGLDAGGDGYLTHPVEPTVLVATVNAFLRARRAEEEMRKSEAKFRAVFDNAYSGILLLGQKLTPLEANRAMCEILGRPLESIIDRPLAEFMPADTTSKTLEIEDQLQRRGTWRGVFPLLKPDESLVHLEWNISEHSLPGVRLAVVTDITERTHFEAERNELLASERIARAEAERANRLKDDFLGTVSHELRTPLNSILLRTQLLKQCISDPVQLERGLAVIERNTQLQAKLISDLLDVSRITSGKLRLEVQALDLATTIRSALEALGPAIEAKRIMLHTALDQRVGLVFGDPARLHQVIWNLVNNATKFTPSGGQIEVRLELVGSNVEISVSDNGQGIAPELLPFLFERFRQGDLQANRAQGGLGLGLAIVKHLVEMHGGTVSASSSGPGAGARFVVSLPIATTLDHSPFIPRDGSLGDTARLDGVRTLIVDDDQDACAAMSQILGETGAVVAVAYNVDGALDELHRFKPQVLVSDIGMPERDGYQLIREIRARGYSYQALPAVALTALARPEDRRRALLAGYQVHLTKPIDASELTATIAALVGRTGVNP